MPETSHPSLADVIQQPAELLQQLIRFDTTNPPGNERACLEYVRDFLAEAGIEANFVARSADRPNLIATLPGRGSAAPLIFYGHVDVVPANPKEWRHPPFEARIIDGHVWGRGALDMKGGIAMMLTALLRAKAEGLPMPGDVILALVSDEEAGGDYGARYLVENHPHLFRGVRYAIGEFGGFSFRIGRKRFYPIMVGEKQTCVLRATILGLGGHGSLDIRGGATSRMAQMLQNLERHRLPVHVTPVVRLMFKDIASSLPFPGSTIFRQLHNPALAGITLKLLGQRGRLFEPLLRNTANPTIIRGGDQVNVVPSEIFVELDCRLLPGFDPNDLISELGPIIGDGVDVEVIQYDPGPDQPDLGLFDTLTAIMRKADPLGIPIPMLLPATTDARFFSKLGVQTYGFLPMALPPDFNFSETIHGPDERIPVDALSFGSEAIYQLLRRFDEGSGWAEPAFTEPIGVKKN